MRYGAKKDANHADIVDAMRKCGATVHDLSTMGGGVPDVIAWVKDQWRLVEVKNPKTGYGRRGLNKLQSKWLSQWRGGPVYVLKSVDDALKFVAGEFDQVTVITPDAAMAAYLANEKKDRTKIEAAVSRS